MIPSILLLVQRMRDQPVKNLVVAALILIATTWIIFRKNK